MIKRLKQYIIDHIDARIDKLVRSEIQSKLDEIDIDRLVAKSIEEINWSDHIDYASLSYHIDIDSKELAGYIDIDTCEIAEHLTEHLMFKVTRR